MTDTELHWLAGLLEGEGCFTYGCSPGIRIGMTDRDVVARVAAIFGRNERGPYKYKVNRKPVFYTEIWGEPAVHLMHQLLPLMGIRRAEKIRQILAQRAAAPTKAHRRGMGRSADCHPYRKHYARGKCRPCYKKQLRGEQDGLHAHSEPLP